MIRSLLRGLPVVSALTALACPGDGGVSPEETAADSDSTAPGSTTAAVTTTAGVLGTTTGEPGSTAATESTSSGTGGPETTGGSSTTGDASGTGTSSTTGEPNDTGGSSTTGGPDSTGGSSTTGEPDSTGGSSTTGDDTTGDTGENAWCCDVGCSIPLMQTHIGQVEVHHGGARIATHDGVKRLRLWSADLLDLLLTVDDVDAVALIDQTLVYRQGDTLHVVDADSGAVLGDCPADVQWGVALDGSYLWTAGAAGLELLELDCGLRWSAAGDLGDAEVQATATDVHVHDPDLGAQKVVRFDAVDGGASEHELLGAFGGWFADSARHWTTQGGAYRVYEGDGALLELAEGAPEYGWGSRMAGSGHVWDIFAPGFLAEYDPTTRRFSGPAILSYAVATKQVELVRLDLDPPTTAVIQPACCITTAASVWDFAFAGGTWVLGGAGGYAVDHLARFLGPTQVSSLEGSQVGRVAVGLAGGKVHLFDLGDDCDLTTHPPFPRGGSASMMRMSADGTALVSAEYWPPPMQPLHYAGVRFYGLPGGVKLGEFQLGLKADGFSDLGISEDATRWTFTKFNAMWAWGIGTVPGPGGGDTGDVLPKIAPDSLHVATSDALPPPWGWDEGHSYIYSVQPSELVGVVDGVVHGFLDDEHLLIGRYQGPEDEFIGSVIVGLDGAVIQATDLPDIRRFHRVGSGEILAEIQPDKHYAILDPFTGDVVWAAPAKAQAALAGPDHVATSDAAGVQLIKWR